MAGLNSVAIETVRQWPQSVSSNATDGTSICLCNKTVLAQTMAISNPLGQETQLEICILLMLDVLIVLVSSNLPDYVPICTIPA